MNRLTTLASALCLCTASSINAADNLQSLDAMQSTVTEFILSEQLKPESTNVTVSAIDKRLRLKQCAEPVQTDWASGSRRLGRVTVQLSCAGPTPWRVRVQATVTIDGYVWVLLRAVQRGDVLDPALLTREKVVIGQNNAALTVGGIPIIDVSPWVGYTFASRVNGGKILTQKMLKQANLISKGEGVMIRHDSPGLQLQTAGVALEGAMIDQRLQVRNSSSGKIVEAVVVGRGLVRVIH